jgi:hypothetical protein
MKHKQFRKKRISKKTRCKTNIKHRHSSSKKGHSRSRSRRLQKGGVRLQDTEALKQLGINDTWSMPDREHFSSFQEYIFGSKIYAQFWEMLLNACRIKGIPVIVLTTGNLIGIIRTIQLLGFQSLIEEVISTHIDNPNDPKNNPTDPEPVPQNPVIDPARHFAGQTKAQVIQTIMGEKGIPYDQVEPVAAFLDDDAGHFKGLSSSVFPIHTENKNDKGEKIKVRGAIVSNAEDAKKNIFYTSGLRRPGADWNYMPLRVLSNAIYGISYGLPDGVGLTDEEDEYLKPLKPVDQEQVEIFKKIKFLCFDWDRTVSIWPAAIPFQLPKYVHYLKNTLLNDRIEVTSF